MLILESYRELRGHKEDPAKHKSRAESEDDSGSGHPSWRHRDEEEEYLGQSPRKDAYVASPTVSIYGPGIGAMHSVGALRRIGEDFQPADDDDDDFGEDDSEFEDDDGDGYDVKFHYQETFHIIRKLVNRTTQSIFEFRI
ncbi:hypothetical protein EK21DRAFT_118196 [Setomelanomma holmii]|uniref:Uncharacterized protein n=1 Tax=Setomelanomma holmii TaxID=210430 RepID=A0A9P4LF46_9PLEO|nr:hypothetical protein EK21DRAFT_118196 [Setomelanomma holmii]